MDHQNRRTRRLGKSPRTRSVVIATGLLLLGITPFAAARTGSNLREGLRNGTATRETQIISNVASSTGITGGYSTRQSNLSTSGGGAVYGCRSGAGGSAATPTPQNPCIRANNLSQGLAFEFNASDGDTGGLITVGTGGDTKKPFTTNATGVATGLNADEVDGLDASQIVGAARTKTALDADTVDGKDSTDLLAKFAQVTSGGNVGSSRGLVATTGDLSACSATATITGATPGEITVTSATASGNTTATVRTFDSTGGAANMPFNLTIDC